MLLKQIFLPFFLLFNAINAIDIYQNQVSRGTINLSIGAITIHSGAYWSIIDNAISALVGTLTVQQDAGFYITGLNPLLGLQVELLGVLNSIKNDGIVSFNGLNSLVGPIYNLVGLSFQNNGEFYLSASGVAPPVFSITAADWHNNGLLVLAQAKRTSALANLGFPTGSIENQGSICLFGTAYQQLTSITGSGCISADRDSTIYIFSSLLPIATTQTLYLADRASSIVIQPVTLPATYTVRGFGNGNKVGISLPLLSVPLLGQPAYSYDPSSGVLTLRGLGVGLLSQRFQIGTGYDSSLFEIVTDDGAGLPTTLLGSVRYNGPVPNNAVPASCNCKYVPPSPGTDESSSSLSSSTSEQSSSSATSVSASKTSDTSSTQESSSSSEVSSTQEPSSSTPEPSSSSETSSTQESSSTEGPSSSTDSSTEASSSSESSTAPSSSAEASSSTESSTEEPSSSTEGPSSSQESSSSEESSTQEPSSSTKESSSTEGSSSTEESSSTEGPSSSTDSSTDITSASSTDEQSSSGTGQSSTEDEPIDSTESDTSSATDSSTATDSSATNTDTNSESTDSSTATDTSSTDSNTASSTETNTDVTDSSTDSNT
ncbi:hypothetical protein MGQ_02298, partial [Candida albicans P76067]